MDNFLKTTEDLWKKGPLRKEYVLTLYRFYHQKKQNEGRHNDEISAIALLDLQNHLQELWDVPFEKLFTDEIKPLELLDFINSNSIKVNNPVKIIITPDHGYISGFASEKYIELLMSAKLNYDEYELQVEKLWYDDKKNEFHIHCNTQTTPTELLQLRQQLQQLAEIKAGYIERQQYDTAAMVRDQERKIHEQIKCFQENSKRK